MSKEQVVVEQDTDDMLQSIDRPSKQPTIDEQDTTNVLQSRRLNARAETGTVVFIDEITNYAVGGYDINSDVFTENTRKHISRRYTNGKLGVGVKLPAGGIFVEIFSNPTADEWDSSNFRAFLSQVGASANALHHAIDAEVDLNQTDDRWEIDYKTESKQTNPEQNVVLTITLLFEVITLGISILVGSLPLAFMASIMGMFLLYVSIAVRED